jgi:hypothetical protein
VSDDLKAEITAAREMVMELARRVSHEHGDVVDLHPAPPTTPDPAERAGYDGLHWVAYHRGHRLWVIDGHAPGRPAALQHRIEVRFAAHAGQEPLARIIAAALNDLDEGEGALWAAALMDEGARNG